MLKTIAYLFYGLVFKKDIKKKKLVNRLESCMNCNPQRMEEERW